ncbi:MAG: hypothetical protein COU68_00140 [Candidatus Pacebacteria bacterium CG10_big_fil_rev_8_21_14_0_10_45_6]|nr:MAG: hypothetical protein COU68_00140 [Candidatus Pacebacteria bacterium CG10_big_fil_rev_8_21_14_0_10_45_6]
MYWLNPKNWSTWKAKRAFVQTHRTISDRVLLKDAATGIYFQEKAVESPLLTHVANPVMKLYYALIVKPFLRW